MIALEDGYGLVSGFRRLEAYARLNRSEDGFAEIPAFLRRGADKRGRLCGDDRGKRTARQSDAL
ncbi:hypothetical protein [Phaeobacter inhibens]|uniref:hypothetical protein n=1 Tax=Phaeobacter inhibens TaxID=221822 RepID=UPI0028832D79|nr:hypothetical protein [Phaeobacter inhibens]